MQPPEGGGTAVALSGGGPGLDTMCEKLWEGEDSWTVGECLQLITGWLSVWILTFALICEELGLMTITQIITTLMGWEIS